MTLGKLSCGGCGSPDFRRIQKMGEHDDRVRWLCRACIIAHELAEHARARAAHASYLAGNGGMPTRPIARRVAAARSRARRRDLPATLTTCDWTLIVAFFDNACAYCGDKWEEIEHATPVHRGGGSTIANCLPACDFCNNKKHRHTLEELLAKDLWPHRTERLERVLAWLRRNGRVESPPSDYAPVRGYERPGSAVRFPPTYPDSGPGLKPP